MRGIQVDGQRLRQIRIARKLTQQELAVTAGVGERTVRNAEAGCRIRYEFLEFICLALGIHVSDVAAEPDEVVLARREERNILRVTNALSAFTDAGDLSECRSVMAPSVKMNMPGPDHVPFCGEYRGLDGMQRLLEIRTAQLTQHDPLEVKEINAAGDIMLIAGTESVQVISTGRHLKCWFQHFYLFERERVARIDVRMDTHACAIAFSK